MSSELFAKGLKIRTEIWGSEGLDHSKRSMLNLAMISALNRPHKLRALIRGAFNNGLSRQQIAEVFLQVAAYVGVPAAVDSFRLVRETFAEIDMQAAAT